MRAIVEVGCGALYVHDKEEAASKEKAGVVASVVDLEATMALVDEAALISEEKHLIVRLRNLTKAEKLVKVKHSFKLSGELKKPQALEALVALESVGQKATAAQGVVAKKEKSAVAETIVGEEIPAAGAVWLAVDLAETAKLALEVISEVTKANRAVVEAAKPEVSRDRV